MGTRNLITVYSNGEYKVAQYGQWDGYPSGQGIDILEFLRSCNIERFKESLHNTEWITHEEIRHRWLGYGHDIDEGDGFVSCDLADRFDKRYPELSRDTGAKILNIIYGSTDTVKIKNSIDFANDSLFCEFAYCVDLDKMTFEVFEGFNNSPIDKSERFYSEEATESSSGDKYYPVRIIATFDLNNLPTNEDFLKQCDPQEECE